MYNRFGGREEARSGNDDLVTGTDAQRPQGNRARFGTVRNTDAVAATYEGGELGLERLNLRTEYEATRLEHVPLALRDLIQQSVQCRSGGKQRDRHAEGARPFPVTGASATSPIRSSSGTVHAAVAGTPTTTARSGGTSRTTTAPAPSERVLPTSTPDSIRRLRRSCMRA